jgi:hypothetical protein
LDDTQEPIHRRGRRAKLRRDANRVVTPQAHFLGREPGLPEHGGGGLANEDMHIGVMDWIDPLYLGEFCLKYQRRSVCPDPVA